MNKIIDIVRNKKLGYKATSKMLNLPLTILRRYIKKDMTVEGLVNKKIDRKPILLINLEKQLVDYCEMENNFYGLIVKDIH